MHCRRLTRLTNAHSKKWGNHEAALALFFAWYNFCRLHMAFKAPGQKPSTPAMQQGLADEVWTIERLLIETTSIA